MPSDTYTLTISDVGVSTPADLSVTSGKIANDAVITAKILDGAVTSAKILDGTIVAGDIANNAITTDKLLNLNVTTGKIADDAITSAKILDGTIVAGNIADGTITSGKIAAGTIVDGNISSNTIALGKIAHISAGTILGNATAGTAAAAASPCTTFGFQMLAAADATGGRTVLSLGSMSTQPSNNVSITGGTISGVTFSGTSVNVSSPTGTLPASNGGTGYSTFTSGDMLYASGPTSFSKLPKGASTTYVLHGAGGGTAPSWGTINLATDVTGVLPIANGGSTTGANADTISFLTTGQTTDTLATGELRWNSTDKTLDMQLAGDVTLQIGQETNIYVHNAQGAIIPNGSVVYIFGSTVVTGGAVPAVKFATNADGTAKKTLGVTTQDIPIDGYGYVTTQGLVRQLDTTAYTAGTSLYLGTGGALTATEPAYPATSVRVAISVLSDTDNGSIYVQPQLFSDGRVAGQFQWGATNNTVGPTITVANMTSSSNVIIQERNTTVPNAVSYSVVCNSGGFIPYASGSGGTANKYFSYIAFV